ncbi:MAG: hypothetical protein P1P88_11635, partial [Bacteroidales bacterium]|nr:hypothetical protein [Bacteroidales bacterium]
MNQKLASILLASLLLFQFSCVKEKFSQDEISKTIDYETTIATPIGYKTTSFQDIFAENIASGELTEDEYGLLWFRFNKEFLSLSASDLLDYPVFSDNYSIVNNTGSALDLNPPETNVIINQSFYMDFGYSQGTNTEEIDSILLNNLDLDITVILAVPVNANLKITFPGITYHGIPYSKDLILSSTNSFADLMEYTIHLDNQTINKNRLQIDFALTLNSSSAVLAVNQNIVDIAIQFSNIDFQAVYGYIGQHTINSAIEQIMIDLNNSKLKGSFNFDHSSLDIVSENSFGVPFQFNLNNYIYSSYDSQNQVIEQYQLVANLSDIVAFPGLNQLGDTINDTTAINSGPIKLYFQDFYSTISGALNANSNPDGNVDYNFVLKDSKLNLSSQYSVPFWGYTSEVSMQDTVAFELRNFFANNFYNISRLLFVLNFT